MLSVAIVALLGPTRAWAQAVTPMSEEPPVAASPEALVRALAGSDASMLEVRQQRRVDLDGDGTEEVLLHLGGVDAQAVIAVHRADGWHAVVARSGGSDEVRVQGWDAPVVSGSAVFAVLRTEVVDDDHSESIETAVFTSSGGGVHQLFFETGAFTVQAFTGGLLLIDAARRPRYRSLLWNSQAHRVTLSRWSRRPPAPPSLPVASAAPSGSAPFPALVAGAAWRFRIGGTGLDGEDRTGNAVLRVVEVRPEGTGRRVRMEWTGLPDDERLTPVEVLLDEAGLHHAAMPQMVLPPGLVATHRRGPRLPRGYDVSVQGGHGCFNFSRHQSGWSICFDATGAPFSAHSGGTGTWVDLDHPTAIATAPAR